MAAAAPFTSSCAALHINRYIQIGTAIGRCSQLPACSSDEGCVWMHISLVPRKIVMLMNRRAALAVLLAVPALLAAPQGAQAQERVMVFAAASLKNALDDVNKAWAAEDKVAATIAYAASSALAKQIEEGAPADIFISADLDWMTYLSENSLTKADTEVKLLGNRIVLIAPKDSKAEIEIAPGFDLA